MDRMNQTHDIMRQHLQQYFVDLGNVGLASDRVSEFALHGREGRFHVAALVVVSEEFFALEIVVVEQTIPRRILHAWLRLGVATKRYEWRDSHLIDVRDHLAATVRL